MSPISHGPKLLEHTDLLRTNLAIWPETALHTRGTAPPSGNMRNRRQRPEAPGAPWRPKGEENSSKPLGLENPVQSCMGSFSLCGSDTPYSKVPFARISCLGVWLLLLRRTPDCPTPSIYTCGEKHPRFIVCGSVSLTVPLGSRRGAGGEGGDKTARLRSQQGCKPQRAGEQNYHYSNFLFIITLATVWLQFYES